MSRCGECGSKECCGSWMEEEHYRKVKALERQLAEAREFEIFVSRMIKLNLTHHMTSYTTIMAIDEKLKEKDQ